MDTFDLSDLLTEVECAWCFRKTSNFIKAFDGRVICRVVTDCWRIGCGLCHIPSSRMAGEAPALPPKALNSPEALSVPQI